MDIKKIIDFYKNIDLSSMEMRSNKAMNSVWLTPEGVITTYPSKSLYGIHSRMYEGFFVVRLYYCISETEKIRITIQDDNYSVFRMVKHGQDDEILDDLLIENFNNLSSSEEGFFQQSLVENFGTMTYDVLLDILDLKSKVKVIVKGILYE